MDGKWCAAGLLRTARHLRGLTQRDLAQLCGVPQPSIAAIESINREPSLSLLSAVLEAAGLALHIELKPLPRFGAVNTARQIHQLFREENENLRKEDSALRTVLSFRDFIRNSNDEELNELIEDPPNLTGNAQWDAFLAAVVEEECVRRDVPTPRWVNDGARFLKPFWYLSKNNGLHEWEFTTAPAAFVRHWIFVAAEELASV
jgi:transcriptional regulator with XRE-family HTH domain